MSNALPPVGVTHSCKVHHQRGGHHGNHDCPNAQHGIRWLEAGHSRLARCSDLDVAGHLGKQDLALWQILQHIK